MSHLKSAVILEMLELANVRTIFVVIDAKMGILHMVDAYMQKAGDCGDISSQFFLDFPQNFRLRMRNQYCTQAIA